jgi:hypothetical protein
MAQLMSKMDALLLLCICSLLSCMQILNNDSANAYAANGLGMVLAEKGLLDQVHFTHLTY